MKSKIFKIENLTYILLVIFLSIHFKFFENAYIILKSDYDQRLTYNYGYCERNSYGFIKYIEKKYKIKKNIQIFNDEVYPLSDAFIYKPKRELSENQIILINYNEESNSLNLDKYKVIEKFKNCFYLEKK